MYVYRLIIIIFFTCYLQGCIVSNRDAYKNPYDDNYSKIATLKHRDKWNGANVNDPSCIKVEDSYYLYSSDTYYIPPNINFKDDSLLRMGFIPVRSSVDLVHWNFEGWVFDSIPKEAFNHVKHTNNGKSPNSIWAPHIFRSDNEYRLYYCVSSLDNNGSCIGLATSGSPLGPWKDMGTVVKTTLDSQMNAVDPTVIHDRKTGKDWMIYGSYYNGLYCIEIDPLTGKSFSEDEKGICVARRACSESKNIEAPEIVYNEQQDMYYLFVSYDPEFTYYNLRVGRSKSPQGPFLDYFGKDLKDTANNYPILTYSYMFNNHQGWSGNGHCGILKDKDKYFLMHQGRLAPDNLMTQLQCREVKWLKNGWPVLSPERFNNTNDKNDFAEAICFGTWEVIELKEIPDIGELSQGQLAVGEWKYTSKAFNMSSLMEIKEGTVILPGNTEFNSYTIRDNSIEFTDLHGHIIECKLYYGWDWENENATILFSGILPGGHSIWGKKI